ncbi:hypothetical protein HN873_036504 [Arachis hypogaea]
MCHHLRHIVAKYFQHSGHTVNSIDIINGTHVSAWSTTSKQIVFRERKNSCVILTFYSPLSFLDGRGQQMAFRIF